jgi:HSP20 family molecular chaperone IbpA
MKRDNPDKKDSFHPPVRMTEDSRRVYLWIELPGISEEQIRIDLEKRICTISIVNAGARAKKAITVPPGVRLFQKKFSDGVLELILDKTPS